MDRLGVSIGKRGVGGLRVSEARHNAGPRPRAALGVGVVVGSGGLAEVEAVVGPSPFQRHELDVVKVLAGGLSPHVAVLGDQELVGNSADLRFGDRRVKGAEVVVAVLRHVTGEVDVDAELPRLKLNREARAVPDAAYDF